MSHVEQAVVFDCAGEQLVGVISSPAAGITASGIGVVIVVGGPQYRAGSHRQFVLMARALAAHGHNCLRFDYRGMGDSTGTACGFEHVAMDIHVAVKALRAHVPGLREIALWGLCDGASAILLYLDEFGQRAEVDRLCLVNPWIRTPDSLAKAQVKYYYLNRLRQKAFWAKLVRGQTGLLALKDFFGNLRQATVRRREPSGGGASYQNRMAAAWQRFPGRILLMLCGDDYVAKEFIDHVKVDPVWARLLQDPRLTRHDLSGIDHTFSTAAWRGEAEHLTSQWLSALADPAPGPAPTVRR